MTPADTVEGERGIAQVGLRLSRSVRLQRRLALLIVGVIGAGVLVWYYVHVSGAAAAAAAPARASTGAAVASEMKLPALSTRGRAATATEHAVKAGETSREPVDAATGSVVDFAAQGRAAPFEASIAGAHTGSRSAAPAAPPLHTNSPVLLRPAAADSPSTARGDGAAALETLGGLTLSQSVAAPERAAGAAPAFADSLIPTATAPVQAAVLASRRWLLPKGSFLDCTLETAIDSTLPGMVTCVLAIDVFGADGRVVLLERGTKLVGETRSEARAGQARVAVLWSEARTPTGVVVALASPGTDALGRAGIPGEVDNHFRARFGAAVLLSIIDGAISAAVAREQGSAGFINNAQGTQSIATEALRNTVGIPPTINVAPGARIQVFVARDVDFQSVYRLATRVEH